MRLSSVLAIPSLLLVTALAGCHISTHNHGNNDNVDIGTPFGSMQVKTNANVETSGLGITPYPGARMVKKDKDSDSGAADVNMSFGNFHLGVKAFSYTTTDSTDKVLDFYKKDLSKYGAVLQCKGNHSVGDVTRTASGLTCDFESDKSGHISWNTDVDSSLELRTGSKQHQHIVAVNTKDGETKINLVALDLPGGLVDGDHGHKDTD